MSCRIFVGDLGNEVNDDVLQKSFQKFTTLLKAKVVRDKRTNKTKGQCSRPPTSVASWNALVDPLKLSEVLPSGAPSNCQICR